MKKFASTKRALLISTLSFVMCIAMLAGTTFAWFTDSVTSANNVITSGNLDADVYYGNPADKKSVNSVSTLFSAVSQWEPGAVAYENLTVANLGSLDFMYTLTVSFSNQNYIVESGKTPDESFKLSDVLMVGIVPGGVADGATREEVLAAVTVWDTMENYEVKDQALPANTNAETFGLVIYWQPDASDNDFNLNNGKTTSDGELLHVDLGVTLVATQLTSETDGFDDQYDADAEYPKVATSYLDATTSAGLTLNIEDVSVTVPAGAPEGNYTLEITKFSESTDENGKTVIETDISIKMDGVKVADGSAEYEVAIQIDPMSEVSSVKHKGEEVTSFNYDPITGLVTFTTDSFSPFSVEFTQFGENYELDENNNIIGGLFKGKNPAEIDASLSAEDSKYIAVDFVKDGVKYYRVSERATTVIVDDNAEESYVFDNGDYTDLVQTAQSGKLWSVIRDLQNNEHSTVYLMPGTYNEGTTIGVYSSMDIFGLGDTGDVKVVKTSSSSSNRHLFNVSGTKADYINVTISNMTLDATAKTTNGKDNAAVQSIRKSKVKCYDLDIIKGTGWDAVAFYVNGNNAVDGVKYPAYLYAENCSLNTTRTFGIVTTSGTYKFYHNGVTYSGNEYTNNSGSIKKEEMDWNDWEW